MKRIKLFIALIFISTICFSQHKITLQLSFPSEEKAQTNYFFASNLNGWNPSSTEFQFQKNEQGKFTLSLTNTNVELIQFKITRGTWDSVESTNEGKDRGNRVIRLADVKSDTTIVVTIENWKDKFSNIIRKSTATQNVKILSNDFLLGKLGKSRRVWIYLPEGYETSKKKYPVIYMHDGQNLFDELTGTFGEWGVDECLDTLGPQLKFSAIIVGIDNGGKDRLSEYSPYDFKVKPDEVNVWDVKGTGSQYLESLVYDLKPYIDQHYRTISNSKHTAICGSSMGGLISLYGIMRYPGVFGSAGVFSPAFWTNVNDLEKEIKENTTGWHGNVYMIAGELEGKKYTDNMNAIADLLRSQSKSNIIDRVIPAGQHNEAFWRSQLPYYFKWLLLTF